MEVHAFEGVGRFSAVVFRPTLPGASRGLLTRRPGEQMKI